MKRSNLFRLLIVPSFMLAALGRSPAQDAPVQIAVHWDKVVQESRTTPTLQVVVNPPLRRGTSVHDNAYQSLHDLGADYVRYVPWLPYPRLGVAELEDRKSTRLNSSHTVISYAVFCLKKKKKKKKNERIE